MSWTHQIKELSCLLQLHDLRYIGHKALDSALCVLTPPSEDMDVEETVKPYDGHWCKPLPSSPKPKQIKHYPLCKGSSDASRSVLIWTTNDGISVHRKLDSKISRTFAPQIAPRNWPQTGTVTPKIAPNLAHLHDMFVPLLRHISRPIPCWLHSISGIASRSQGVHVGRR